MLNCLLSTVGCRIIEEFVCYNLIHVFAYSSSKQTDLSSTQDNLPQNPKFLTEIQLASRKSRVLVCKINTPLPVTEGSRDLP